jgi:hypothetical protein
MAKTTSVTKPRPSKPFAPNSRSIQSTSSLPQGCCSMSRSIAAGSSLANTEKPESPSAPRREGSPGRSRRAARPGGVAVARAGGRDTPRRACPLEPSLGAWLRAPRGSEAEGRPATQLCKAHVERRSARPEPGLRRSGTPTHFACRGARRRARMASASASTPPGEVDDRASGAQGPEAWWKGGAQRGTRRLRVRDGILGRRELIAGRG